ncbi:hypothetical protein HXA31_20380 [Salipaludibacillus agaradhaerens]|uniref:Gp28/Gp37-like domain-containing protein n=1 Tax=Salipaludibacillus agaradhaerens TaxID=76935 RepID=A0A9Q4B2C4_SALAG|nr:hypothetical protein [Salipaludibacillus agaradhaerens]MCR6096845.1 hypothetical protein [Salipaludibacillus agaradhaerens]MCR6116689.1 hypothetical protein [Salipaludibacillus agaradhaerens]
MDIRVYTQDVEWLHETSKFISLRYTQSAYGIGDFELHINQYTEGIEYFKKGHLLVFDKEGKKSAIIRHVERALDESGKISENIVIKGSMLKCVINQRKTVPPEHTSHDRKTGAAEEVMKHYITNHFINPADPARKVPHFEVAPNKGRGEQISWESRNRNVAEELENIGKSTGLGWTVYVDVVRRVWVFDVIEGKDLTEDNPAGNTPVFFGPDWHTVSTQNFVDSDLEYKNVAYVAGQGEGVERLIIEIGEAEGWDRFETFVDARDVGGEDEDGEEITEEEEIEILTKRGKKALEELETQLFLEAQILTPVTRDNPNTGKVIVETPFEYEKDFNLCDIVQVYNANWGVTMRAPMTEFTEIYEGDGFTLEATFGESRPTLISQLRKKFRQLEDPDYQEATAKYTRIEAERVRKEAQAGLSAEEQARIQQAQENLNKAFEEAQRAEQDAKDYAYEQDGYRQEDTQQYADEQDIKVEDRSRDYSEDKAQEAEDNSKHYTDVQKDEVIQITDDKITEQSDRITDVKTTISVMDGEIDLRVKEDEVIQAVNLSTEGLKIDVDKVAISGDVEIVDGDLKVTHLSAATGTFSGEMIAGTINIDDNIRVGNQIQIGDMHSNDDKYVHFNAGTYIYGDGDLLRLHGDIINLGRLNSLTVTDGSVHIDQLTVSGRLYVDNRVDITNDVQVDGQLQLNNYIRINNPTDNGNPLRVDTGDTLQFIIYQSGNVRTFANFTVDGNLNVSGNKNSVVDTDDYGKRLMYALETPDSRFMDVIENYYDSGVYWVDLGVMFTQTISDYTVLPVPQGVSSVKILETEDTRFKISVESDDNVKIAFMIYGKRRGFEHEYMSEFTQEGE